MAEAAPDNTTERMEAIETCVDSVRDHITKNGVNRESLETVKQTLLGLAARTNLFSYEQFPVQENDSTVSIYLLSEDDDHSYSLYAVAEREGCMSPPHDHTTWAVIAGIEGEEVNRFYERVDDGATPGKAELCETGEQFVVETGTAVALLPDDIHSIHCLSGKPTLNFHMYGMSIEHLEKRKKFNMKDGTYGHYTMSPSIYK